MSYEQQLGGVVGLSGALSSDLDWTMLQNREMKKQTPLFLYHGGSDPMIPLELARYTYQPLSEQKFNVTLTVEDSL